VNTPAPWITADELGVPSSELADEAIAGASWVLWMLSGRKYGGIRTVTELYCQTGLGQLGSNVLPTTLRQSLLSGSGMQVYPMLREGALTNEVFGLCSTCGCEHTIRLRGGPVRRVEAVYDGERPIPLSDIAIYDYSYITAPNKCWCTCGDLEVTYTYGSGPPAMGKIAARDLASQYILAVTDEDECTLPQRVTQISRQGVSWTLLDPQDFLDNGRTGLYTVDLFLRTVNPDKARLRSRVFSPDMHRGRAYRWAQSAPQVVQLRPLVSPAAAPQPMTMAAPTAATLQATPSAAGTVQVWSGRPLRWVVPGTFTEERPPVITARPSGEEVPPDTLLWRSGNYTLDLTIEQVEQLLPPGSVLVVSTVADDGSTTKQTSHPVERRTL
jgi:hypothetical protein